MSAAAISTMVLALAACAPDEAPEPSEPEETEDAGEQEEEGDGDDGDTGAAEPTPVDIGIIYSKTGPLAAYGENYINGLNAGFDYATDGTMVAGDYEINLEIADDGGDPAKAVTAFKEMVGNDVPIIGGTIVSGIATQLAELAEQNETVYIVGPAATDATTGINDYTFRSGRQTLQDVATAGTFLDDIEGSDVLVFAQDTEFGKGNFAAVDMILGSKGANVDSLLVAESVTEFTPFAQQILDADPDLLFVAWAGDTSAAMWQALTQQDVFSKVTVTTGLGDISTYGAFGDAGEDISFLNHYFPGAGQNAVEDAMMERIEAAGGKVDLFSPDGFNAALMIVHALENGDLSADGIIGALEGWTFDGPKGPMEIRASDHALIQPMYRASLTKDGEDWVPELLGTADPADVAPAEM